MGWLLLLVVLVVCALLIRRVAKPAAPLIYYQPLTRDQAFELLGLTDNATQEDIIAAHRKLIQKVHPDAGGTQSLAQLVNHAKDVLLNP